MLLVHMISPIFTVDARYMINLIRSIKLHGIIIPLIVTSSGKIIDGRCRYYAAKSLGIEDVPVRESADLMSALRHVPLTEDDYIRIIHKLLSLGASLEEIASKTGKSIEWLNKRKPK